jgi:hypothetical protein
MIEELHASMTAAEVRECYANTDKLLQSSQDFDATDKRLAACARIVFSKAESEANIPELKIITLDKTMNLSEEVKRYEAALIRLAMELTGNSVVRASRLLELKNHQTLIAMLGKGGRHEGLIPSYAPKPQRRSYTASGRKKNRRARA